MTALDARSRSDAGQSQDGVRTRTITWTDPAQSRFSGREPHRLRATRRDATR